MNQRHIIFVPGEPPRQNNIKAFYGVTGFDRTTSPNVCA
jgi:hypothetical protein